MTASTDDQRTITAQAAALVDAIDERRKSFPTPTGLDDYEPSPTDTIISTYVKSGTTLLQNLAYQLVYRTLTAPGSATPPQDTFSDISVAVPWLDYMPQMGTHAPAYTPRLFKTHSPYSTFARFHARPAAAPRHIVVVRSPFALQASFLDFLFDELVAHLPGAADTAVREAAFHKFVRDGVAGPDNVAWFEHARGYTQPLRENVLVLFYEDITRDLKGTTRTVARFLGIGPEKATEEVVEEVARACERDVMAGDSRFQCHVEAKAFGHGPIWKVMREKRGNGSFKQFKFTEEEVEAVNRKMQDILGYADYETFREETKKAQMQKYGR